MVADILLGESVPVMGAKHRFAKVHIIDHCLKLGAVTSGYATTEDEAE